MTEIPSCILSQYLRCNRSIQVDHTLVYFLKFTEKNTNHVSQLFSENGSIKGTVMQIEKALINDRLCVSKASSKFRSPTFHNFAVIYP